MQFFSVNPCTTLNEINKSAPSNLFFPNDLHSDARDTVRLKSFLMQITLQHSNFVVNCEIS